MEQSAARELVMPFLTMDENEIYSKFIDHAGNNGMEYRFLEKMKFDRRHLYIPGTREDRVLLVAHVDSKFPPEISDVQPIFNEAENVIMSGNRGIEKKKKGNYWYGDGIRADDRAGVAILWHLLSLNLGHSILLLSGEEDGCLGARQFMSRLNRAKELQQHQFALEFDRHDKRDIVFYQCWTPEFIEYCLTETGYRWNQGSLSDICVLCKEMCGANISVGYYHEHTPFEELNIEWFTNTINVAELWLSRQNIPSFQK